MTANNKAVDQRHDDHACPSAYGEHNWHGIYGDNGQHLYDYCDRCRIEVPLKTNPGPFLLICSECYEPAVLKPPREWLPAWGPPPPYSHWDGEALCAVMTRDGYHSAQPKLVEMQP